MAEEAAAQGSDLVLLVDLSSSMRKNEALPRTRRLLQGLLEEAVGPGSQVALVPFGAGVHETLVFDAAGDEGGAAEVRSRVNKALEDLKARDSYSYLGAALDAGIEHLKRVIVFLFIKIKEEEKTLALSFSLILSGAIGNHH